MKELAEYIIPFSGMKIGNYNFDYKISDKFFGAFEYSEIKKGDLIVELLIEKSETMMVAHFDIKGEIVSECAICLGELNVSIDKKYRQIFKFSDEEDLKLDDEITFVSSTEFEVSVAPFIVEFINLSKPNKTTHKEGQCDESLVAVLDEYLLVEESNIEEIDVEDEEVTDPRWNALKKLKNK